MRPWIPLTFRLKPRRGLKPGLVGGSKSASVVTKLETGIDCGQDLVALVGQILAETILEPDHHARPAPWSIAAEGGL